MSDFYPSFPIRMYCWGKGFDVMCMTGNIKIYFQLGLPEIAQELKRKRNAALLNVIKLMRHYDYSKEAINDSIKWMLCHPYGE